ncbi:MAG: DHH family phosphoesterase, partial [Clostridia bacterium]|nr:DHH family phosphoesterase [Clostridia bacterium]
MKKSNLILIRDKIKYAKQIALICHIRPDGDTLGSALALYNHIVNFKNCTVFCDDTLPQKYDFLKGYDKISSGDINNEYDLIICIDCSDLNRTGKYNFFIKNHNNVINIDHHISNEKFGNINYVIEASSTCEIIYFLLKHFDIKADKYIYTCIYCGLASDTGNFSHSNTTYVTFEIAAELAKTIGDISFINQKIFKETPLNKLMLLAEILRNIKLYIDGKMAVLSVSNIDVNKYQCDIHDTEGFVDYAINIQGVEIGAILLESEKN